MRSNRGHGTRVCVLCEDRRTEMFFQRVLNGLGFARREIRVVPAPRGQGSAEAWVRHNYPEEVRKLRSKRFQRLALVAVRDGDALGVRARKAELDEALREADLEPRGEADPIAVPVPTWSIETWLLVLLGERNLAEDRPLKRFFERLYPKEGTAIRNAARAWRSDAGKLPSMVDGAAEMRRLPTGSG